MISTKQGEFQHHLVLEDVSFEFKLKYCENAPLDFLQVPGDLSTVKYQVVIGYGPNKGIELFRFVSFKF
jgi:hypothetical protein